MFVKKEREFFFFWTETKRERARALHATASMDGVMQRGMKKLEKSWEEKVETYQKLSSKGEEDAILLLWFLSFLIVIMHNKEREKAAADLREDQSFHALISVARIEEEH
jgi:hypothetical protein